MRSDRAAGGQNMGAVEVGVKVLPFTPSDFPSHWRVLEESVT